MNIISLEGVNVIIRDFLNKPYPTYTNVIHIKSALEWLKKAQDVTSDNGVSAYYSLVSGWAPSFVETTGYIIDTFLDCSKIFADEELVLRANKMGHFLLSMQLKSGGFRTYSKYAHKKSEPTVFNTGQDLLGLVTLYKFTKNTQYREASEKAGYFLANTQEKEGFWLRHSYESLPHTYDSRVAYALISLNSISRNRIFIRGAIKNLDWVTKNQHENGWIDYAELPQGKFRRSFTHTISYCIEGLLESGIVLKENKYINSARKTADKLLNYFLDNNFLPATFKKDWMSDDTYTCLTGDAQLSSVWLKLFRIFGDDNYLKASVAMNKFIKSTHDIKGNINTRGIKGSYPIYGDIWRNEGYSRLAYLNWATKFFVDALVLEDVIVGSQK